MEQSHLLFGRALPKEIQDLIGEYNADHRHKFNQVLEGIKGIYGLECQGCYITRYSTCLYSYIAEEFVCSSECMKLYITSLPPHMQSSYANMIQVS